MESGLNLKTVNCTSCRKLQIVGHGVTLFGNDLSIKYLCTKCYKKIR